MKNNKERNKSNFIYVFFTPIILYFGKYIYDINYPILNSLNPTYSTHSHTPTLSLSSDLLSEPYPISTIDS